LSDARTVDPAQSSECKLGITRGVMKPVLRWLAGIVAVIIQPFGYFSRPTHPASSDVAAEKHADGVVEEAQAVVTAIEDAVVRQTTVKSFTDPITTEVMVDPDAQTNRTAHTILDDHEIQRRRDLVRTLFNDFWTGAYEKPAAFVERLDQAEDYVNERLAASGEFWQLDAKMRVCSACRLGRIHAIAEKMALLAIERFLLIEHRPAAGRLCGAGSRSIGKRSDGSQSKPSPPCRLQSFD